MPNLPHRSLTPTHLRDFSSRMTRYLGPCSTGEVLSLELRDLLLQVFNIPFKILLHIFYFLFEAAKHAKSDTLSEW